jgi:acetyltransferase-like isoleucine patch superfamily enzyme
MFRTTIYIDMVFCFVKYRIWTNQYIQEGFYKKSKEEKISIGNQYFKKGIERDTWQKDFVKNRKFLNKYTQKRYELPGLREISNRDYKERYNMGNNCLVEYNVELSRQHYLLGKIKIGENVLLAKNVFIDYSGGLEIGDNTRITNSCKILTHYHRYESRPYENSSIPDVVEAKLIIGRSVIIGTGAIILASCNYIGNYARIGAGAVVTKDVPDFAVVVGVPAKLVRLNE